MNAPKWTEYPQGLEVLEANVKPGVRYRERDCTDVYIAAEDGRRVLVGSDTAPRFSVSAFSRLETPVTILDWPDHCGPRPDTGHPTCEQVVKNAPSVNAYVVWKNGRGGKGMTCVCSISQSPSKFNGHPLGYLEFSDD